jgi:hypothetical protein
MSENEIPIQDWVTQMTTAHNHHAQSIDTLEGRSLNLLERLEHVEEMVQDLRISLNKILTHLDITIEEDE